LSAMKVRKARFLAAEWVKLHASQEPWYKGAYFSGSTVGLPDEAELSPTSDVDVIIVTDQLEPPLKLGKFIYRHTLIEATYLSWNQFTSVEEVLSSYHLAPSFQVDTIIDDPTGFLRRLHTRVSTHFCEEVWVRRRCENALQKIEKGLRTLDTSAPWHDQVTAWLFPTGVTTHVILVAALRNPTVRLRYLSVHDVLMEYRQESLYLDLLKLLRCTDLTPQEVEHHLNELERTFDAAANVSKTPFFFSSDITRKARTVAIDGSRELIHSGYHREAVFWILATFARCHKILAVDGDPDQKRALEPAFDAILADLGITSPAALIWRADETIQFLPLLWEAAESILLVNPGITAK
jgi:hypothetical protein